jgi:hypothetical protein
MSLFDRLFSRPIARRVDAATRDVARRLQAAEPVNDTQTYWTSLNATKAPAQLPWHEHREILAKCMAYTRTHPWAHRYHIMHPDFLIGAGVELVPPTPKWFRAWWDHPLNHMDTRVFRWAEGLSSAGELFIVLSRNPVDRMSYVREVPAILIDQVNTDPNDLEHELSYHQVTEDTEGKTWPAAGQDDQEHDQVMLHFAVNRPIGSTRGLPDLAPVLTWLERYNLWLEDRVRINRYKGAYLWHIRIENALPGQLEAKRAQYSRIPSSGSIIVSDAAERWEAVQPNIAADDVEADGKAIRLMIAAGMGLPLHFLSEGESATRATAREMNVPTYRMFAHRQYVFRKILEDVAAHAARRAGKTGRLAIVFDSVLDLTPEGEEEAAPTAPVTPVETPPNPVQ